MNTLLAKATVAQWQVQQKAEEAMRETLGEWSINNVLTNATSSLKFWGGLIMVLVGIVMIIVAIFKIAQGLMSHGKTQVSWPINILLILVGAMFCVGGSFFMTLTDGNNGLGGALANELTNLGG